ncbi:MAG TPA: hypothetical protein VEG67_02350 [Myxococcota bacterium]|nr:hypothetical protein [Myxococcota bacterium]
MENSEDTKTDSEPKESGESAQKSAEAEQEGGFRERGRKERVLHTRVSEQLAEDIRRVAEDLRVPVSNLVRNVLEETFSVVESVTDNLGTWLEDVATEVGEARGSIRPRPRRWARHWGRERDSASAPANAPEAAWENPWDEPSPSAPEVSSRGETPTAPSPREENESPGKAGAPLNAANPTGEPPDFSHVLGWQLLVMNRPQSCAGCGRLLVRGDRAYLGLTHAGMSGLVLCSACMDTRE